MKEPAMIRRCRDNKINEIYSIVNDAAKAYSGHIPADCYHEPYMPLSELQNEMKRVKLFGWEEEGKLLGVMGLEPIKDVTMVRHAYVLTSKQGLGIGHRLLVHLEKQTQTKRLLVGTWKDATWAVDFYKKHGFRVCADKDLLLRTYWDNPGRQNEVSVVLEKVLPAHKAA
jgi:N-acetylglutamate synthase-like GNAT family acetyltransferase